MFRQERNFGIVDSKGVCREVDIALMAFLYVSHVLEGTKKLHTSISRPNRRSTDVPSRTENEQGRWRLPSLIWAEWIRPRILAVPTPTAMPANLESTSLMILSSA